MMSQGIIASEFVYEAAPFPSCHASTIVQTAPGTLLCAFFGGSKEGAKDVCVWCCRKDPGGAWQVPEQIADGSQPDGQPFPCWNPVLFQPRGGPLMLFYKVGPNPSGWWGMVKTSDDDARTWSRPVRLPDGILGPIKNKPVELPDGMIVSPSSVEGKEIGWRVYFELSTDAGRTWTATAHVEQDPAIKAIQPSVLIHPGRRLQAIGRTKSAKLFQTWSEDAGRTWGRLTLTDLPNCNSGTDAVTLSDGRHLLVYNHSNVEKVRVPLNVAVSRDGLHWDAALDLETEPPGQYSYPAVIQSADGLVHITYTWKRQRIKYALIDPQRLQTRPLWSI